MGDNKGSVGGVGEVVSTQTGRDGFGKGMQLRNHMECSRSYDPQSEEVRGGILY